MSVENSRLQVLDALRGLAALMVALFHFTTTMPGTILEPLASCGWLGVQVFFVVSGFVIPYSLMQAECRFPGDYGRFLLKRMVRLHPPYLASAVLVALLWQLSVLVSGHRIVAPHYSLLQAALHVPLLNGICGVSWMQTVYWTLAIEFQFYLLAGLLAPFLQRSGRWAGGIIAALLALSLIPQTQNDRFVWIWPHLPLFVLGILVCLRWRQSLGLTGFLLASSVAAALTVRTLGWMEGVAGLLTAMMITFSRISWPRPLLWLGTVSYSLYLVHIPLGSRVVSMTKRFWQAGFVMQAAAVLLALGVSLAGAWFWHRYLETPCHRLASSIRYNRRTPIMPG